MYYCTPRHDMWPVKPPVPIQFQSTQSNQWRSQSEFQGSLIIWIPALLALLGVCWAFLQQDWGL